MAQQTSSNPLGKPCFAQSSFKNVKILKRLGVALNTVVCLSIETIWCDRLDVTYNKETDAMVFEVRGFHDKKPKKPISQQNFFHGP